MYAQNSIIIQALIYQFFPEWGGAGDHQKFLYPVL